MNLQRILKNIKGFDTKEAYRDSIRSKLEAEYADLKARQKENDVYYAVISGSDITLPDNLLEYYEADFRTVYTNIATGSGTRFGDSSNDVWLLNGRFLSLVLSLIHRVWQQEN